MEVQKKVLGFIQENELCKPGDTLIVAFSGGADSTALLDILANLPGYDLDLVVAHLNHLLRGEESEADESVARETAACYGYPFEVSRVDVAALAAQRGLSLEEAGRAARYAFFLKVAEKHSAAAIALGHHKDDQAETVMMRLLRGSGCNGLSGMRPKSPEDNLVRPLLSLTRLEIEAYLRKGGLTWREDGSNADSRFLRNRIRHELIPYLERFNPDIRETLNRTAEVLAADDDILESVTAETFSFSVKTSAAGAEVDLELIVHEPPGLRKRIYRKAIQAVKGDLRRISFVHLAAIDRIVFSSRPNSELDLPCGIRVMRAYGLLLFKLRQEDSPWADSAILLDSPGRYTLPCGGMLLVEEQMVPPVVGYTDIADNSVFYGQLKMPLSVRYFRNGDRFIPLGMNGHKKLKNLFVDRKIPLKLRRTIPLVVDRGEIVWVCGIQAAQKTAASASDGNRPWIRMTYTAEAYRY